MSADQPKQIANFYDWLRRNPRHELLDRVVDSISYRPLEEVSSRCPATRKVLVPGSWPDGEDLPILELAAPGGQAKDYVDSIYSAIFLSSNRRGKLVALQALAELLYLAHDDNAQDEEFRAMFEEAEVPSLLLIRRSVKDYTRIEDKIKAVQEIKRSKDRRGVTT